MRAVRCLLWLSPLLVCLDEPAASEPGDYPPATAPRPTPSAPEEPDWMSLPRPERLWRRDGIGLHTGVVDGKTYYTVTDDKTRLLALYPATGRDVWQTKLPKPAVGYPSLALLGNTIIVASAGRQEEEVQLVQATTEGRIGWSRTIRCTRHQIETASSRLFLRCHEHAPLRGSSTLIEIDASDGSERSRLSIDSKLDLMPNGYFCKSEERRVECLSLVGGKLAPRWSTLAAGADRYARLQGTASFVVRSDETSVDVFRAKDGKKVFHRDATRNDGRWIEIALQNDRMFLFGSASISIVRLTDGRDVGKLPWKRDRGNRLLARDGQALVVTGPGSEPQAALIDDRGKLTRIDLPPLDARTLMADVVLTHGLAPPRYFRRDGTLSAYSLSRSTAAAAGLPAYDRVVAILEHSPDPYRAYDVLAAIRRLPAGLDDLEKVIRQDRGYARVAAIGVAGASGLLRFLPVLRDALNQTSLRPKTKEERERLLQAAHALASLDDPQAAQVLLAYWQSAAPQIAEVNLHHALKETVESMIWRYSGERDWGICPDRLFPVGDGDPTRATLGTPSPGSGDVLDREGRWALLCEARNDDDGNGRLSVQYQMHGGTTGDQLHAYLVLGSGAGSEVDDFLAAQPTGRYVVVAIRTCLYLVDTQTGAARALPRADGRVRVGPKQDAPVLAFSRNGIWLAYLRSNGRQVRVVLRDVTTGAEREIDPGSGNVLSVFFDNLSSRLVMDVADFEGDLGARPWAITESDHHRCREGADRTGPFTESNGPSFRRRHVSVHGGPVEDADHPSQLEPDPPYPPKYLLVPAVPNNDYIGLPIGPFHWKK